jgi:hypothetical protein
MEARLYELPAPNRSRKGRTIHENPKSLTRTAHAQCAIETGPALVQINHMLSLFASVAEDETAHELGTFSAAAAPHHSGSELYSAFDLAGHIAIGATGNPGIWIVDFPQFVNRRQPPV